MSAEPDSIRAGMEELLPHLKRFVRRHLEARYGPGFARRLSRPHERPFSEHDPRAWIRAALDEWEVLRFHAPTRVKQYLHLLRDVANAHAHHEAITLDERRHALETMRLLAVALSGEEASGGFGGSSLLSRPPAREEVSKSPEPVAYDHSLKAGNRGDVWKHYLLLTCLEGILSPSGRKLYRESHAGSPRHALCEGGEWRQGIGRLLPAPPGLGSHPYFEQFAEALRPGDEYPASWVQVLGLARRIGCELEVDLYDTSPQVRAAVARWPHGGRHVHFSATDGLAAVLQSPPADFTLIDSPFDARDAWDRINQCIGHLRSRSARFMIWYPISWPTKPDFLVKQAGTSGVEVHWQEMGSKPSQTMKGCGIVVDEKTFDGLVRHGSSIEKLASAMGGRPFLRAAADEVAGQFAMLGVQRQRASAGNLSAEPLEKRLGKRPELTEILSFLGAEEIRATYGAVGQVLGLPAIAIGSRLGARRVEASWIVSTTSGLPTGYSKAETHPALLRRSEIIRTGQELLRRFESWRGRTRSTE